MLPSKERILTIEILSAAFAGKKLDRVFEETVSSARGMQAAPSAKTPDLHINQIYNLIYGVARRHFLLKAYVESKLKQETPSNAVLIIEVGLYELAYNRSAKSYAVISEALKLADYFKIGKYKPLINAILRRFAEGLEAEVKVLEKFKPLPDYILSEIKKVFPDSAPEVINGFLNHAPFFLAVNTTLITPEELIKRLEQQEIDVKEVLTHGTTGIKTFDNKIFRTPEFKDGFFMIQDLSSQIAVKLLEPFEGMKMLDLCSAPGGKAIGAAILTKDKAEITAVDISPSRLFKVYENINRMKIGSIKVLTGDFLQHDFSSEGVTNNSFDRILLDPPCSAFGVIGRNPDVAWKKSPDTIKDLCSLQLAMLLKAMPLLKSGGRLVYSVCTFAQAETTDVINQALATNKDFKKVEDCIYTIPNDVGMDGLFVAVLEKQSAFQNS